MRCLCSALEGKPSERFGPDTKLLGFSTSCSTDPWSFQDILVPYFPQFILVYVQLLSNTCPSDKILSLVILFMTKPLHLLGITEVTLMSSKIVGCGCHDDISPHWPNFLHILHNSCNSRSLEKYLIEIFIYLVGSFCSALTCRGCWGCNA